MAERNAGQERQGGGGLRENVSTDDAGQLPTGAWVNRADGRLYRSVEGHSLVAIQSRTLQEFTRLSINPYESDDALRIMSARLGVAPQF